MQKTLRLLENNTFYLVKDRREKYVREKEVKKVLSSLGYHNTRIQDKTRYRWKYRIYIIWENSETKETIHVGSWFLEDAYNNIAYAYQGHKYTKEKLLEYLSKK